MSQSERKDELYSTLNVARRIDLADLNAFLTNARTGGYRRAAAVRGVIASALSHAMRGLEARLGVRLFHRTSRTCL
ncbi:helix-turn-helix domain-containing protein [Paraburkholderia phenoliruptrix]|uniref:helix-turn-helix domain-containing protein n=1 Tax=Paraburkholderia phenoliruptrix TaxID=252970 RepID=UPI002869AFF6|nr:LysR family transcriptional regulator [Paraburkholderia phenoliruptrix]WMY11778.1 LysR family transcriptional regulator [Paraburkholderia phenoliruptrix]